MADRMAVMKDGRINQIGSPRELYEHPADRFTAEFLGDINFIQGVCANGVLKTGFGDFFLAGDADGASFGAIRPERIRFVPAGTRGAFAAEIISGSYLGDSGEWLCRAGNCELLVRECAPPERKCADRVFLTFDHGYLMAMK